MKNKSISYIYAGTQGTAGLYLNSIINSLKDLKYNLSAYASYYYPFNNAKKVFFKRTDLAGNKQKTKFRPYIRYIELITSLIHIFIVYIFKRPNILNYSLNSTFIPEIIFLKLCKNILHIKVVITCHDVLPFRNAYIDNDSELKRRKEIFKIADYLLVHNQYSKNELIKTFNIVPTRIVFHSFPLMNLNDMNLRNGDNCTKDIDFLFIGHLRVEKGIETLLKAWKIYHEQENTMDTLYIVGNLPKGRTLPIDEYSKYNVVFKIGYVDDFNYINYLKRAKCVILPYQRGTNSGIPSSVLSVGSSLIVSDIQMFKENSLIQPEMFFNVNDEYSLCQKMIETKAREEYNSYSKYRTSFSKYNKCFSKEVKDLYNHLLNI